MTYAKIENGRLVMLRNVPHVSNPRPETLAAFAAAHGYKPYAAAPAPDDGGYYHHGYTETASAIEDVYTPYTDAEAAPMKIAALKRQLADTDYVAAKLAEATGERRTALETEYAALLTQRQQWRDEINALMQQCTPSSQS